MDINKDMQTASRVLVIDDNPVNLKITAALTRRTGALVDTSESAEDALERLAGSRPDLIVTDLRLTGMSGLEFTRAVKGNPSWASIPVILVTADNSKELENDARQAGCASLICKPIDSQMFPGLIAAFLPTHIPLANEIAVDDQSLKELHKEFLAAGAKECRVLLSGFTASRLFVPALDLVSIRKALHRWAGVGTTIGFPEITRQARALEALTESPDTSKRDVLREALIQLLHQFTHAVPLDQAAPAPRKEIPPVVQGAVVVRPLILVADDDATIRAVIKRSLQVAGMDCRLADNGALACAMARNNPPDAIVLDVNMPRMNGFQVLYALRNQWSTRDVPVILLTARREQTDILQAAQLGAAAYITKPFEINDLLARLDRAIAPG